MTAHAHRCPGCKETYGCDCSMPEEESVYCSPCWAIAESMKRRVEMEKAIRFDEIVLASRHYFAAFNNEHRLALKLSQQLDLDPTMRRIFTMDAQKFASLAHEHYQVLKLANVEDLPVCNCVFCGAVGELENESPERMRREIKERITENLNEPETA